MPKDRVDYKQLLLRRADAASRAAPTEPDGPISLRQYKARLDRARWRGAYAVLVKGRDETTA